VAKLTRQQRIEIAQTRLLRILGTHQAAHMRTLEMKISDAGPFDQRINPHILTEARDLLIAEGQLHVYHPEPHRPPLYYLGNADFQQLQPRFAELQTIQGEYSRQAFSMRVGQALEIAVYRTFSSDTFDCAYFGGFPDLDQHDDSILYSKQEPPNYIGSNRIPGNKVLDFLVMHGGDWAGIECKNIREWIYPDRPEVKDMLTKAVHMNCVPVLIARRIHPSTFLLLNKCGLIIHQTYNQRLASFDADLALRARAKNSLAYFDIKLGNEPDARLIKFLSLDLPAVLPAARAKFDEYYDLLCDFCLYGMPYAEFAARVRRRGLGQNEEHDWEAE
jgi:hypothetical protein